MREIKFRAWDEENKQMIQWDDAFFYDTSAVTNWSGDFSYIEMPLMQYVGLKDKNGVEIYEGDVSEDHLGIGVVEYKNAAYRVNYRNGECKWFIDYLVDEKKTIEVIGNIYENPEFLSQ
jgi:uncharacterized phage protein (TIGR01671 family)